MVSDVVTNIKEFISTRMFLTCDGLDPWDAVRSELIYW